MTTSMAQVPLGELVRLAFPPGTQLSGSAQDPLVKWVVMAGPGLAPAAGDLVLCGPPGPSAEELAAWAQGGIAAAVRAGVPFKVQSATLGTGSDAGPFSRAGLQATTLLGFKVQQMVAFYHQKWDSPEVLTTEPLSNVLKLTLEWIRNGGR